MNHDYAALSTEEIQNRLAWIVDRSRYRRACQMPEGGEDAIAEHYLLAELHRRKVAQQEQEERENEMNFFPRVPTPYTLLSHP